MVQRLTLRRRLSYNTRSNKRRIVRTPGGKLVYLYLKKKRTVPRCAVTKEKLHGITPSRPSERPRMSRRLKTVKRAYGGVLSHKALKERIIRAFLIDEQKVVKVMKAAQATVVVKAPKPPKPAPKPAAKAAAPAPQKKTDKKGGDKKPEKKSLGGDKKPTKPAPGGIKIGKVVKK